jgi:DNA repair protein RecO (recombination protein O)
MSSKICTTEGFVLRSLRYGDTSRVATVFTHDLGKFSIIAKGARVPGSPFGASLDLFTISQFVVYHRTGRDLQMLKSGDVEHHFPRIQTESVRFTLGCAILEFVDRMMLEGEPAPPLFGLALRALSRINQGSLAAAPEVVRAFQLRTAALLGYGLRLEECLHCGTSLAEAAVAVLSGEDGRAAADTRADKRSSWLFRPAEGGAVCSECAGSASGYSMTPRALLRLRAMVMGGGAESRVAEPSPDYLPREIRPQEGPRSWSGSRKGTGSPSSAEELRERWQRTLDMLVEDYLRFHVERYRGLRSLGSWDEAPPWRAAR